MGMAEIRIAEPERRDRLLLISAFAMLLLIMLCLLYTSPSPRD